MDLELATTGLNRQVSSNLVSVTVDCLPQHVYHIMFTTACLPQHVYHSMFTTSCPSDLVCCLQIQEAVQKALLQQAQVANSDSLPSKTHSLSGLQDKTSHQTMLYVGDTLAYLTGFVNKPIVTPVANRGGGTLVLFMGL